MNTIGKIVRYITGIGTWIAGIFLTGIMVAIVLDVILRLARIPIIGSYELTEVAIIVTVAFALPYTALKGGHVAVDLLVSRFKPRSRQLSVAITVLFSTVIWALVVWASIGVLQDKWLNEASYTLKIPYLPFRFVWVIGLALFCIVYLFEVIKRLTNKGNNS
jgi:TRAP-type C4-dicarboxylate transport system permease small subunit